MTTSFRTKYPVIRRQAGMWVDGYYYANETSVETFVMMSVQQASVGDRQAIEALPYGNRVSRYIKAYTDTRLQAVSQDPKGPPGDIIIYDDRKFLVIGESIFQTMKKISAGSPVSHYRYYGAELIETAVEITHG